MFVTEEEAETKWCPHARAVIGSIEAGRSTYGAIVGNRVYKDGEGHGDCRCIGPACMMWKPAMKAPSGDVYIGHSTEGHDATIRFNPDDGLVKGGICGLAGWRP